jgi:hypothetical protein
MTSPWIYGPCAGYWMEDTPSGNYYEFVFDILDLPAKEYHLLVFLSKLSIIERGTIYETVESIRIKAK